MSPGIGDVYGKKIALEIKAHPDLLDYSVSDIKKHFPIWDKKIIREIIKSQKLDLGDSVNRQWDLIQKNEIQVLSFNDDNYPFLLKEMLDSPFLLFYQGQADLNHERNISIIGTRKNSEWSKSFSETFVSELSQYKPQIISGLALGIDSIAHRSALNNNIPTIAVMANGLLNVYPTQNRQLAEEILKNGGGLLTEHLPMTFADKQNFPLRNRIVAGISSMTVLIESPIKGGSMITGKLAAAYNREVGCVPGRPHDEKSGGCHYLIKSQIAHMITSADDIAQVMDWDVKKKKNKSVQLDMYLDLHPDESEVINYMKSSDSETHHIDDLMLKLNKTNTELASLLLKLELSGYIRTFSGKRFGLS